MKRSAGRPAAAAAAGDFIRSAPLGKEGDDGHGRCSGWAGRARWVWMAGQAGVDGWVWVWLMHLTRVWVWGVVVLADGWVDDKSCRDKWISIA